jgi:hypothetical protein
MPQRKPRTKTARKRIQKPAHPLSRQREQKPLSQPFLMAREHILAQLQDTIASCDELFENHGETCLCEACCVVSNMVGCLRVFRMVLEIS